MELRTGSCKHGCGCSTGSIVTKSGQDCVYCDQCGKHQYNAPKVETGRAQRSVSTVHAGIKAKVRSKIIERANGRCERCGKPSFRTTTGLHVGHIVSVDDGLRHGLTELELNSEENLIAECDECNLGHGAGSLPIRMYMAIIRSRLESEEEGAAF